MINKLCPGSLDWATWWTLSSAQIAALERELEPHLQAAKK